MADGNLASTIGGDVLIALEKLDAQAKTRDTPSDYWALRGVPLDVRAMAMEAAEREGMTVGAWLSQLIVDQDRPSRPTVTQLEWFTAPGEQEQHEQISLPALSTALDLSAIRQSISEIVAFARPGFEEAGVEIDGAGAEDIDWTLASSSEAEPPELADLSMAAAEVLTLEAEPLAMDPPAPAAEAQRATWIIPRAEEGGESEKPDTLWRYVRTAACEATAPVAEAVIEAVEPDLEMSLDASAGEVEYFVTFVEDQVVLDVEETQTWLPLQEPVRRKSLMSRLFGRR